MVFIVGLSDDFNGIAKSIPDDGVRLAAILLTVAAYLLLTRINPALPPAASTEMQQQENLTWSERLSVAKKAAFRSSLVIINVGTGGFCLFLLTGNLLDFYPMVR
jgi:hypothetical protein